MKEQKDYLLLKWGTFKGCNFTNSPEAYEALKEFYEIGMSMSAALQNDTPRQKELLCTMIDKVNGTVINDWSGDDWTNERENAKKYVLEYHKS